jgi:hypothetical protein
MTTATRLRLIIHQFLPPIARFYGLFPQALSALVTLAPQWQLAIQIEAARNLPAMTDLQRGAGARGVHARIQPPTHQGTAGIRALSSGAVREARGAGTYGAPEARQPRVRRRLDRLGALEGFRSRLQNIGLSNGFQHAIPLSPDSAPL